MPLGLSNAPKTFQKIMQHLLGKFDFVKIYLDDVLVFSPDKYAHRSHLDQILTVIQKSGLVINKEKSKFYLKEVCYLGRVINEHGIGIDKSMLCKKVFLIPPKNKKGLQRLIGTINWARPFIPNLSNKMSLLTDKLKNEKFTWTDRDARTLEIITKEIANVEFLMHADLTQPFQLYSDASDIGIGAILKQNNKSIAIFSKKLNSSERNYTVVEKEFFGILKSVQHFKNFLLGSHVTIYTDNRNLTFLKPLPSSRMARWMLLLSEFSFEFKLIRTNENLEAGSLSRMFCNANITISDKSSPFT